VPAVMIGSRNRIRAVFPDTLKKYSPIPGDVDTVNVPEVEPAAICTVGGAVGFGPHPWLELESVIGMAAPSDGAGAVNVTVPVVEFPPIGESGLNDSEATAGGTKVSVAVFVTKVPYAAVIWNGVGALTPLVATENEAPVEPAGTVTLPGKVTVEVCRTTTICNSERGVAGSTLDSVTASPPAGAGPVNVTCPVEAVPPGTVAGLKVSDASVGG